MRRIVVVMLVATAALVFTGAPAGAQASDAAGMEQEFVSLLNDLRSEKGLAPLAHHDELVGKARNWSATMAAEGRIWHSNLRDGITAPWRRLGENVGMGGSVRALHDALVASPGHYANLIDPEYNHIGIGVVIDADGTIFVSQEFMELAPAATGGDIEAPASAGSEAPADGTGTPKAAAGRAAAPTPSPARVKGESPRAAPAAAVVQAPAEPTTDADLRERSDDDETAAASTSTMTPARSTTAAHALTLIATVLLAAVATGAQDILARRITR